MLYCPNDQKDDSETVIRILEKAVWEAFDLSEAQFQEELELTDFIFSCQDSKTIMLDFSKDVYFFPQTVGIETAILQEDSDFLWIDYGSHGQINYLKSNGIASILSKSIEGLHTILVSVLSLYVENGTTIYLIDPEEEDEWDEEEFFNDNF